MTFLTLSKKVFSVLLISSLGSGAVAGTVSLVNKKKSPKIEQSLELTSQGEKGRTSTNSDLSEENKSTHLNLDNIQQEVQEIGTEHHKVKQEEKENISKSSLKSDDFSKDISSGGTTEDYASVSKTQEEILFPQEDDLEKSRNIEKFLALPPSSPEEEVSKKEEKPSPEEDAKKKAEYDNEKAKHDILLEFVWYHRQGTEGISSLPVKTCYLLKNSSNTSYYYDSLEVENIHDSIPDRESCDSVNAVTAWAEDKNLESSKEEGLWVRGKTTKVKELFDANLNSFKSSNFIKKEKNSSISYEESLKNYLDEQNCTFTSEKDEAWVEVQCLSERINFSKSARYQN